MRHVIFCKPMGEYQYPSGEKGIIFWLSSRQQNQYLPGGTSIIGSADFDNDHQLVVSESWVDESQWTSEVFEVGLTSLVEEEKVTAQCEALLEEDEDAELPKSPPDKVVTGEHPVLVQAYRLTEAMTALAEAGYIKI